MGTDLPVACGAVSPKPDELEKRRVRVVFECYVQQWLDGLVLLQEPGLGVQLLLQLVDFVLKGGGNISPATYDDAVSKGRGSPMSARVTLCPRRTPQPILHLPDVLPGTLNNHPTRNLPKDGQLSVLKKSSQQAVPANI